MNKLLIASAEATPEVNFDPENGLLEIEGKLIPEDVGSFFVPIFNWIDKFDPATRHPILIRFCLYYYNTSSSKRILDIMKKFDALFQQGMDLKIQWEYENGDEDAMQDGEDFKALLKIPFEIKMI